MTDLGRRALRVRRQDTATADPTFERVAEAQVGGRGRRRRGFIARRCAVDPGRRRLRRRRRRSTSLANVEVDLQQSAPCAWTRPSLRYTGPASADTASVKFAATVCYRRAMSYVLSVEPRSRRTFVSSMCCSLGLHSNAMPLPRMSAELWRRSSTPSASGPTGHTSSAQSKRGISERCWRCFMARIRQVPDGAGTIGVSF